MDPLVFLRRSKGEFLVENHKSSAHGRLHKNTTMGCGGASANSSMWIPTQCHFQWLQQLPFHCRWGTWSEEPEPSRENAEPGLPRKGWQKLATEPLERERERHEKRERRERDTRERGERETHEREERHTRETREKNGNSLSPINDFIQV